MRIDEKDLLELGFERQADDYAESGEKGYFDLLIIAYKKNLSRNMDLYVTCVQDENGKLIRQTLDFTLSYEMKEIEVKSNLRLIKSIVNSFAELQKASNSDF